MELYTEDARVSQPYREQYLTGLEGLLERRRRELDCRRAAYMTPEALAGDPEKYRRDFISMLGWPLTDYRHNSQPAVRQSFVGEDGEKRIYRLQLEIWEGLWFYGLLFLPANASGTLPLVISQHGGLGTPELCANFYGSSANYNDMTRRVLRRGAMVFSPQLLLWNKETYGVDYNRTQLDAAFKQAGGSITAVEIFSIRRSLDWLLEQSFDGCRPDPMEVGMIGLSYGGFYTLFTAAAEPRIASAYASGFFNDRYRTRSFCDWTWQDAAGRFKDAEIAALIAPRSLYLEMGDRDELFDSRYTQREFERLLPFYRAQGAQDRLRLSIFHGVHELDCAEEGIDFLFAGLCR